jgi:hypothetical protein
MTVDELAQKLGTQPLLLGKNAYSFFIGFTGTDFCMTRPSSALPSILWVRQRGRTGYIYKDQYLRNLCNFRLPKWYLP